MRAAVLVLSLVLLTLAKCPHYPLYKQCDGKWGNDHLGTSSQTICQAGCAMSSVSMMLAGHGVKTNPGDLNSWLISNGGYVDGDLIVWGAVDAYKVVTFQAIEHPTVAEVEDGLKACHGIIANVRSGTHWVLLTGYKGDGNFTVNDPGFPDDSYNFDGMSNFAVYH